VPRSDRTPDDDLLEEGRALEAEAEDLEERLEEADRHAARARGRAKDIDEPPGQAPPSARG
jgi:hypothetical protein